MVATTRRKAPKVPSSRGYGQKVSIDVNSLSIDNLIFNLFMAVSGPSLADFLIDDAHKHFVDEIYMRFVHKGDDKSGQWAPLHDATIDIRRALGYPNDNEINVRTGDLLRFVVESYDILAGPMYAQMDLPGAPPTEALADKLRRAQRGSDDNILGYGPTIPRPILALDMTDMATLLGLLEMHIMLRVAVGIGGTP